MKETLSTAIARLEERVNNLIEVTTKTHEELLKSIETLDAHVNHEIELMDARVKCLEKTDTSLRAYWKVIIAIVGGIGGFVTFLLTLLKNIKVI